MTSFGDKIKDLPVDKDQTTSPDEELVKSIFEPKERGLLSKEVKLIIMGIALLYILFTQQAQNHIYGITKNDNLTKVITVCIVIILLFLLNRWL